jgi:hypothetical protein
MTMPIWENAGVVVVKAAIVSAAVRSRVFQFVLVCKSTSFEYIKLGCMPQRVRCPPEDTHGNNKPT